MATVWTNVRNPAARQVGRAAGAQVEVLYRLGFHVPTFGHILGFSAILLCMTPLVSALPLDYSVTVGACVSFLSLVVLFPLSLRAKGGTRGFPATPFVLLNFVYFVAATVVPLAYPHLKVINISFEAIPLALLILCLGFLCFDIGIVFAGRLPRLLPPESLGVKRVRGLGVLFAVLATVLWGLRVFLAANGLGIAHATYLLSLGWEIRQLAVVSNSLAFVPLCLCLARLACKASSKAELHGWQRRAIWVMAADLAYYLWAGARLPLLWEVLVVAWCAWLRLIPPFPRRKTLVLGICLVIAMPIVYAQRGALRYVAPQAGEDQVALTRGYLLREQKQVMSSSFVETLEEGLDADSGRLTAIGPFSAVVNALFNRNFPLMWGETWREELPVLVPHLLWPAKPVPRNIDAVIDGHFNLPGDDDLTTCETELLANLGVLGLCAGMLLFGVLTEGVLSCLVRNAGASEPVTACVLCSLPVLFLVEADTTGMLAGLRILPVLWLVLSALAVRRPVTQV